MLVTVASGSGTPGTCWGLTLMLSSAKSSLQIATSERTDCKYSVISVMNYAKRG